MSRDRVVLLLLLVYYLAISLHGLTIVPPVYEDEPWQASTGVKLANEHVFGSDLFGGFHGMEQHYYAFMPLHPMLLALTYKLAGFGLLQTRLEPVAMGLLTLLLTYALGRRLFGPAVGALACALLLFVRLTGTTRIQLTGILLLDMARIARYDMVVPVFGLLSLHAYLSAAARDDRRLYLLAGGLAALAGLSHVYGAFWIVCLALLALFQSRTRALATLMVGFAGPWMIYALYVMGGVDDWRLQVREYGPRFEVLNPSWYWHNIIEERRRYGPGLGAPDWSYVTRPGFWTMLVALPAALTAMARRALRGDDAAATIVIPTLVFPVLFALLIWMKLVNYTITFVPVAMIAVAWGAVSLWRRAPGAGRKWVRAALACVFAAVVIEGITRAQVLLAAARSVTPYADYIAKVRAHVPPRSRILGLHNYWFGLDDFRYTTWFVPLRRADPLLFRSAPSIEQALDDVAPDVVLIDARMRGYFATAASSDRVPNAIQTWMHHRGFRRIATVDDNTYGLMEIFVRSD
jgi:4-amino-4-deoxy-L-arabinose transferase-like glycosyltransferase